MTDNTQTVIRKLPSSENPIKIAWTKEQEDFLAFRYETPAERGIPELEYLLTTTDGSYTHEGVLNSVGEDAIDNAPEGEYEVRFKDWELHDRRVVAAEFRDAVEKADGLSDIVQLLDTDKEELEGAQEQYDQYFNDFTGQGLVRDLWQVPASPEESAMLEVLLDRSGLTETVLHQAQDPDSKTPEEFDPDRFQIHSSAFDNIIPPRAVVNYSFGLKPGKEDRSGVDPNECEFEWTRFQANYPGYEYVQPFKVGEFTWYNQEWGLHLGNVYITLKVRFKNGEEHCYQLIQYIRDPSMVIQAYQQQQIDQNSENPSPISPTAHPTELLTHTTNTLNELNKLENPAEGEPESAITEEYKQEKANLVKLKTQLDQLADLYKDVEDPETGELIKKRIFPINNTLLAEELGQPISLRLFLYREEKEGFNPYYKKVIKYIQFTLVDWTSPDHNMVNNGHSTGFGLTNKAALDDLLENWERENNYYTGKLYFNIPNEALGNEQVTIKKSLMDRFEVEPDESGLYHRGELETDGKDFWGECDAFLSAVATAGMVIGFALLVVAPIPGSRLAAAALATTIFTSAAAIGAGAARIYRRRLAGEAWGAEDTIDAVGIALDAFPLVGRLAGKAFGQVARNVTARVLKESTKSGRKILISIIQKGRVLRDKGLLIMDISGEVAEGFLIGADAYDRYQEIADDPTLTPLEKLRQQNAIMREMALMGALKTVSVVGIVKNGVRGKPEISQEKLKKLNEQSEVDLDSAANTTKRSVRRGLNVAVSSIISDTLQAQGEKLAKRMMKRLKRYTSRKFWICEVLKAEPVHSVTGAVYLDQEDFDLPGHLPLTWSRSYNSQEPWKGVFGFGWTSPADARLIVDEQESEAAFYSGEKQTHLFSALPDVHFDYAPVESEGDGAILAFVDDQYEVTTKAGQIYRFEAVNRAMPDAVKDESAESERFYRIASIRDRRHNRWEFEWDGDDLIGLTSTANHKIHIVSEGGLVESFSWNGRKLAQYEYKDGDLIRVTDTMGLKDKNPETRGYRFEYKEHRLAKHSNENGVSFHYEYGEADKTRCYHTWGEDPNNPESPTLYDTKFRYSDPVGEAGTTEIIAADETVSVIRYDAHFRPFEEITPYHKDQGKVVSTRYRYDGWGRTTMVEIGEPKEAGESKKEGENTPPITRITRYEYDDYGNVTKVTRPDGISVKTVYNQYHLPTKIIDAKGNKWINDYVEDRLVRESGPQGSSRTYRYGVGQSSLTVSSGNSFGMLYDFDEFGQVEQVSKVGEGIITRYERDKFGLVEKEIGKESITRFEYDDNFRLKKAQLFAPDDEKCETVLRTATFHWDNEDNLLRRIEDGVTVQRCTYTGLNKLASRQEADGNIEAVAYKYNGEEQLIETRNEKGETYTFERDPLGRVIKETDYWGHTQEYGYNALGDLVEYRSNNQTTHMFYDELGRLENRHLPNGKKERFKWDDNGNLTAHYSEKSTVKRRYDKENRLIGELQKTRGNSRFILRYAYDPNGNLEWKESHFDVTGYTDDDNGNFLVQRSTQSNGTLYEYDDSGLCEAIIINGRRCKLHRDDQGRIKKEEFPEFNRNFEYDNFGRLKEQKVLDNWDVTDLLSGAKTLAHRSYGYDNRGNLNMRKDNVQNRMFQYRYSPNGNLTTAIDPDHRVHQFKPDPAGNLLQRKGNNGDFEAHSYIPATSLASAPHSEHRESWSYRFDTQGRCINRNSEISQDNFEWDSEGQLITSKPAGGETTEYSYDASGRRVKKETGNETTEFYWDGDVLLGDKVDGTVREFVYYPGTFEPFAMIADDKVYFYNNDINGAPLELFDQQGKTVWSAEYNALGEVTKNYENSVDNPLRLQGQYFDDETGLHYNRHRYYDPKTGSFISTDPIGLDGGTNPYQYAPNTWEWIDPLGLSTKTVCQTREKAKNEVTAEIEYVHNARIGKTTDAAELVDQIRGQVDAMNRIIKNEGMKGLKQRIRNYNKSLERKGRNYIKRTLGKAGKGFAWLHEPDMRVGGLPEDVFRQGISRNNSILGGQASRVAESILEMSDDITSVWWSLKIRSKK